MFVRSLAVAGLLAHTVTAGGQRHERLAPKADIDVRDVSASNEVYSTQFEYAPADSVLTAYATVPASTTPSATSTLSSTSLTRSLAGYTYGSASGASGSGYAWASGASGTGSASAPACTGQTLNVLSASLDWWYAQTYTYVASIFSVVTTNNSTTWSVITPTASFDVTSAVSSPACATTLMWDSTYNVSVYSSACSATPGPFAAATTVLTQTAYGKLNATAGTGAPPAIATPPPPAVITANGAAQSYSAGVPFVFFSAYEIMSKYSTTYKNGSAGCAETTQRVDMEVPFSFEFEGGSVNGSLEVGQGVVGDVAPAFLELYDVNAAAGSWVAKPTVVVVVEKVFGQQSVLSAGATEITATALLLPSPTLPSFTIPAEPPGQSDSMPIYESPVIESTQKGGLDVPFQSTTATSTHSTSSSSPTSTKISLSRISSHDGGSGGKSAVTSSQASPTNALEVLTDALLSTGIGSVILAGLGASSPGGLPAVTALPDTNSGAANDIPHIVLGSETYTANAATQFSLGPSAILTPGGEVVVSGTTVSLANDASSVVIDGTTKVLSATGSSNADAATITAPAVLYINGKAYAPNAGTTYLVSGKQLTPGGAIVITNAGQAETISLDAAADKLMTIVDGTTVTSSVGTVPTAAPILTIDGKTFTAVNDGATYVIDGKTLTPGDVETVTISGHTYVVSLSSQATALQIVDLAADGQATSTTLETLFPAQGAVSTEYMTVGNVATASQGASPSTSAPTPSATGGLVNAASSLTSPLSGMGVVIGTILSVLWL